jgi:hypothetical protein
LASIAVPSRVEPDIEVSPAEPGEALLAVVATVAARVQVEVLARGDRGRDRDEEAGYG